MNGDLLDFGPQRTRLEAAMEHKLAITRNYISQPRLSKYYTSISLSIGPLADWPDQHRT